MADENASAPAEGADKPTPPPAALSDALAAAPASDNPAPASPGEPGAAHAGGAGDAGAASSGPQPEPAPPPSDAAMEGAKAAAGLIVGVLFDSWAAAKFTAQEKTAAAAVLVPVLVKYRVTPEWLDRYREELALAAVWGGLAWTGYKRARADQVKPPRSGGGQDQQAGLGSASAFD